MSERVKYPIFSDSAVIIEGLVINPISLIFVSSQTFCIKYESFFRRLLFLPFLQFEYSIIGLQYRMYYWMIQATQTELNESFICFGRKEFYLLWVFKIEQFDSYRVEKFFPETFHVSRHHKNFSLLDKLEHPALVTSIFKTPSVNLESGHISASAQKLRKQAKGSNKRKNVPRGGKSP